MAGLIDKSLSFGIQNFMFISSDTSDGTYNYYGYGNVKGSVLIMRTNKALSSIKYYTTVGDYDTVFAARASKTYVYPTEITLPRT